MLKSKKKDDNNKPPENKKPNRWTHINKKNSMDTYTNFKADKPIVLHKSRRNVHQMDLDYIPLYINAQIDNGKVRLVNKGVYVECGRNVNKKECKKLIYLNNLKTKLPKNFLSEELLTKATIKAYENAGLFTYCPNVKCIGSNGFQLDTTQLGVICPYKNCGQTWCTQCKIFPFHDNLSCGQAKRLSLEKNKNDPNVKYIIENTQFCPKCDRSVEKNEGCDHMHCVCGTYFCFVCGTLLTENYDKHVVYDERVDTYVCPNRLDTIKTGLATKEIVKHNFEVLDIETDDEDNDIVDDGFPPYNPADYEQPQVVHEPVQLQQFNDNKLEQKILLDKNLNKKIDKVPQKNLNLILDSDTEIDESDDEITCYK
jgi:hypothetical protein